MKVCGLDTSKVNRETMPINKYTGGGLKKLQKGELLSHVVELYGFIDLFDGVSLTETIEENKKLEAKADHWEEERNGKVAILQEENKELKEELDESNDKTIELIDEKKKLRKENKKLEAKADHWEEEHSTLWLSVFGALNDGGYGATSTGQIVSFIRDIIKENEELKEAKNLLTVAHTKTLKRRKWDQSERDRLRKENKIHEDRVKYLEDLVGLGLIEHLEKMKYDPKYAEKCLNDGTA